MFKFLHAADLHLDSPLRGLERYEGAPVDEIRGATRRALQNLIALAIEERVAFVLLSGDLYDGDWRDYSTGLFFTGQMARLQDAGIPAFVVAGNHDAASQITRVLRPPENVHIFSSRVPETAVLEDLGVALHGQGFATRSVTEDLSQRYPGRIPGMLNIGLLHTSLDGRAGHEPYAPCTVDGLRTRGYDYWALGHVHKREVVSDDPWIVFPGNTQGRHARETGTKGCELVSVEDGQIQVTAPQSLDVVRWVNRPLDVRDATSMDAVLDATGQVFRALVGDAEGRIVAARLTLTGICGAHVRLQAERTRLLNECRALANAVGAGTLWLEKVAVDTRTSEPQERPLGHNDAFEGLLSAVRELELDATRLSAIGAEFSDLRGKLPPELVTGEDGFDPTNADLLRTQLEEVKELLLYRLLSHRGTG
jgi:exonuclease SbcD